MKTFIALQRHLPPTTLRNSSPSIPPMKTKTLLTLSALLLSAHLALAQGTGFTYQGRLNDGGGAANGTYDFRFRLATDSLGNNYVGSTLLTNGVPAANGLFTVTLDFGGGIFSGTNLWLEVGVRTNGGVGYTTLMPLQALTATPYAITAGNLSGLLPAAQLSGTYGNAVTLNNAANSFTGNGTGLTNVNAVSLGGLGVDQFWKTAGNSNTIAGVNFLGTGDNQPLDFRVNNSRALRLAPTTNAPNFIGGDSQNFVVAGVYGATIGGGGTPAYPGGSGLTNKALANFATVGGGAGNTASGSGNTPGGDSATVAGGWVNSALGNNATVAGGALNSALGDNTAVGGGIRNTIQTNAYESTIGGGFLNTVQGNARYSTIGGGRENTIYDGAYSSTISGVRNSIGTNAFRSVIGGGENNAILAEAYQSIISGGFGNTNTGPHATVAGGNYNSASTNSFAAGHRAKATNQGAFVWADSTDADFSSTAANQFNVRASGGVRLAGGGPLVVDALNQNTSGALTQGILFGTVSGEGIVSKRSFAGSGNGYGLDFYTGAQKRMSIANGGNVGIGAITPLAQFNVDGNVRVDAVSAGYAEGLSLNLATDMAGGGYGGIHFHNAGRGSNYTSGTIKWSILYNNTPEGGTTGGGLAIIQNNTSTRLCFATNGFVGIGTWTPTYQLQLSLDSAAKPGGGSWANSSDARLKKNVQPLTGALEKLTQLRGVYFEWVNPEDHAHQQGPQGGFIAQEVERTFPNWITPVAAAEHDRALTDDGKIKSLTLPFEFDALVVEAIKEQQQQIKARDERIANLEQRVAALEKLLNRLTTAQRGDER